MEMLRTRGAPVRPRLKALSAGHLKTAGERPKYGANGEYRVRRRVFVSEAPPCAAEKPEPPVKSSQPSTQVLFELPMLWTPPPSRLPTKIPLLSSEYIQ